MELHAFPVNHQHPQPVLLVTWKRMHPQPVVLPLYPRNGAVTLRGHLTVSFWQNICLCKCISHQFIQAHTLFLCIYFTRRGAMTAQNRWTEENRFEWMWQLGRRRVLSNSRGWWWDLQSSLCTAERFRGGASAACWATHSKPVALRSIKKTRFLTCSLTFCHQHVVSLLITSVKVSMPDWASFHSACCH